MQPPNRSFYITIISIGLFIAFVLIAKSKLKNDGILLNGKTTRWVMGANMNMSLEYEFYYKGEKIVATNTFGKIRGNRNFVGLYFPLLYYPGLGGHSQLLIQPSDFEKYKIPFPDSLKWVVPYFEN